MIIEIKRPAEATDKCELDKDQPNAAGQKVKGQVILRPPPISPEEGAGPGKKNENWRTKMCDPARQEERCICSRQIRRTKRKRIAEEVPDMIEGHQNYYQPSQNINRIQPSR